MLQSCDFYDSGSSGKLQGMGTSINLQGIRSSERYNFLETPVLDYIISK